MTDEQTLPHARATLHDAVHHLTGPRTHHDDQGTRYGQSLLAELADHLHDQHGAGHGGRPRSTPPAALAALDLQRRIADTTAAWARQHQLTSQGTYAHLLALADHGWRPQDTPIVARYADEVLDWVRGAESILDPPRQITLAAACPACGTTTIYRPDSTGETVRQPALHIGPHGCECQHCHHIWGPQQYLHLARVLGYELPPGVLN